MHVVREPIRVAALVHGDRDELRGLLRDAAHGDRVVTDPEDVEHLVAGREVGAHDARARDVLLLRDQCLVAGMERAPLVRPVAVQLLLKDLRDEAARRLRGCSCGRRENERGGEDGEEPHRRSLFVSMSNHMANSVNCEPEMSKRAISTTVPTLTAFPAILNAISTT